MALPKPLSDLAQGANRKFQECIGYTLRYYRETVLCPCLWIFMRSIWKENRQLIRHCLHKHHHVHHALFSYLLDLRHSKVYLRHWYLLGYLGAIAISVLPLLADYVDHKSRGTCAAFLVLMSSLGALASAEINFSILNNVSSENKIYIQYGVISALIMLLGLSYTLVCLKPGNDYYTRGNNKRRSVKELLSVAK